MINASMWKVGRWEKTLLWALLAKKKLALNL
jgi:hypothetical protein